jgi:hypothetical protein
LQNPVWKARESKTAETLLEKHLAHASK